MRAVVQRVSQAQVAVAGRVVASIGPGLLVLLGVSREDDSTGVQYLADKIANLRIFPDQQGKMNLSMQEAGGEVLVVSQFTLYGDCRKGRRPSFTEAASPFRARDLYQELITRLEGLGIRVQQGIFQEEMEVSLVNQGPVTVILDSSRLL